MTDKEQYRSLCKGAQSPSLFLQDWWLDAHGDWDVATVKNDDKITGAWPYMLERKMGIPIFRNPALTPYLGPHIVYPGDLKKAKYQNFEHEMVGALLERMPQFKVWHLGLPPGQEQVGLFKARGFEVGVRQTFLVDLHPVEEVILSLMDEQHRRKIKKAQRELTITNEPEMLSQLFDWQKATLEKKELGVHFTRARMKSVFDAAYAHGSSALWVARGEGKEPSAMLWHGWDKERAYYLVGARNPTLKDNLSMVGLLWHAMQHSKAAGKSFFDLEGSMDPGVERFFRNFGAKRELYLTIQKNRSFLWKMKLLLRS